MTTALAVVLVLAGIGFVLIELYAPGFGGPGTLAVVCFTVGALLLIDDRTSVRISSSTIIGVTLGGLVLAGIVTTVALRLRSVPTQSPSRVLGVVGIALTDLDPVGSVRVLAEEWTASSGSGRIEAGERVKVVGERGLKLRVERFLGED